MNSENNKDHVAAHPADFIPRYAPLRDLQAPVEGEVHVWFLDLSELGGSLQAALDGPQASQERPPFTSGQLRFARRFYLRLLLGAYLGLPGKSVQIIRSLRGKPVLDPVKHGNFLHFSMAKSNDRLLIGLSAFSHVGVDLEPAQRQAHNALGVARRYFSETEAKALAGLPPGALNDSFLRTWACKEAVVKASGKGIANELCRFTVETDLDRQPAMLEFNGERAAEWRLALLQPESGFLGAVATRDAGMKLHPYRLLPAGAGGD